MTVEDHAEELASALGVDKEEVQKDLENLLEYSVPVEEAKESLRRKYGGADDRESAEPEPTNIGAITTDHANVTVTARVLTVGKRSIRYQGEERVIHEGELADGTGKISYTAWEDVDFEPGDSVTIGNASVREWEGNPELNIGGQTSIMPASEQIEVDYLVGGESDLIDLASGDRGRIVEVTVIDVETKTIDGRDGRTDILSGVLADETARLPFTDWEPHEAITGGATLRLADVYVREFRGVPSINVSEFSTVEPIDKDIQPSKATRMGIGDAVETGGAYDIEVTGHVVGVRDGSGLIQRCPDCGRVVQKGQCRSHGEVDPVDDLRVKAILDDGTGTLTVVLGDELTSQVYGGTLEDAMEAAREAMDQEVVADDIRDSILGREYRVRGNLSVDEYGASLETTTFDRVEADPVDQADRFLEAVQ